MRESGRVTARILNRLIAAVRPGLKTWDIEELATDLIEEEGVVAAFKNYNGYPAAVCISLNDEVVHGIPGGTVIREGDIVSLDFGIIKNGYYGDMARSVIAGKPRGREDERLLDVTRSALMKGIEKAVAGNRLYDISSAVQRYVEDNGFSVVRQFVGHGIGTRMHEEPQVPNFGEPGKGPVLKPGMVIAIEPMVNAGVYDVRVLDDGWTVVTADGRRSAHFEHTVAVTQNGPYILTAE